MPISILKLIYTHNDLVHVSANHVTIFRKVKYYLPVHLQGRKMVFYHHEDGHMIGRNMSVVVVYIH